MKDNFKFGCENCGCSSFDVKFLEKKLICVRCGTEFQNKIVNMDDLIADAVEAIKEERKNKLN